MSSPTRLTHPYMEAKSTPSKSLRVNIPKELGSVEKRAFELTKQFNQHISESASKCYISKDLDDSSPWDHHKVLVKRGENYAQYLYEQNNRNKKDKEEAVNAVNQRVKLGLEELDQIREQENKGLVKKLLDFNNDFGKKVKDLERSVAKQIEKMKWELMENIRNEEKECERRISERSNKLIEESIPADKRECVGRYVRPLSANTSPMKSGGFSPVKKVNALNAMRKLEESREKIKELRAQVYPATPDKVNSKVTTKRYNSGLSPQKEDFSRSIHSESIDLQDNF